jgi:hypothetical protein
MDACKADINLGSFSSNNSNVLKKGTPFCDGIFKTGYNDKKETQRIEQRGEEKRIT